MTNVDRRSFLRLTAGVAAAGGASAFLAACGGSSSSSSTSSGTLSGAALEKAAEAEGTITLYCVDQGLATSLQKGFTAMYPWAKFKTVVGAAADIRNRAITETVAGAKTTDVLSGVAPSNLAALQQNGVVRAVPIETESALPAQFLDPTHYYHPLYQYVVVIAYNSKLISTPPATVEALTDPAYRGKIAFDRPQNALTGATFLVAQEKRMGQTAWQQWLQGLKANNILVTASGSDALAKVQSGERTLGFCSSDNVINLPKGTPVKPGFYPNMVPVVQANWLTKRSPSPNAGQLFVQWAGTEDGQKAVIASGRTAILPTLDSPGAVSKILPAGIKAMPNTDLSDFFAHPSTYLDPLYKLWPA